MECPKCKGLMMLERFSDFLSHFLRLEMHQLRRDHRPDDFSQSPEEPRCSGTPDGRDAVIHRRIPLPVDVTFG